MPFQRPSLPEIETRVRADIEARMDGADTALRRAFLAVMARVLAGATHLLYGFLDWISKQVLPDTAEAEWLERHASIWGVTRKAATYATGSVTFTGANDKTIPDGTLLQRSGAEFVTDSLATIAGGTATVTVTAVVAGAASNTVAAAKLKLASPIEGIQTEATIGVGGITAGTDQESDDGLRARVLERIQQPPHGGAAQDYETWALEVAGVTRAFVKPLYLGIGTVGLFFVKDNKPVTIIPDAGEVAAVQAYIDERRPVTAEVTVMAPTAVAMNFTIDLTTDTAAIRTAVEAELRDLLLREAVPGATILISHIREAISIAAGETDHVLTVPAGNVAHAANEIAIFGAITWV